MCTVWAAARARSTDVSDFSPSSADPNPVKVVPDLNKAGLVGLCCRIAELIKDEAMSMSVDVDKVLGKNGFVQERPKLPGDVDNVLGRNGFVHKGPMLPGKEGIDGWAVL